MPGFVNYPSAPLAIPYAHLNLRFNPFGELPLAERSQLTVVNTLYYCRLLKKQAFALAFTGEKGHGKTSHLLALQQCFPRAPYIYIAENEKPPSIPNLPLVFIDEVQRIAQDKRQRLWRRGTSFVIASHSEHSKEFKQAGLAFHSVTLTALDASTLEAILHTRLENARRQSGLIPYLRQESISRLLLRYGSNVRAIEHCLYEAIEKQQTNGAINIGG